MASKFITAAQITAMPAKFGDPMPQVRVTVGGEERYLFEYYQNELHFEAEEFVGLTVQEAHRLKFTRDRDYLRS